MGRVSVLKVRRQLCSSDGIARQWLLLLAGNHSEIGQQLAVTKVEVCCKEQITLVPEGSESKGLYFVLDTMALGGNLLLTPSAEGLVFNPPTVLVYAGSRHSSPFTIEARDNSSDTMLPNITVSLEPDVLLQTEMYCNGKYVRALDPSQCPTHAPHTRCGAPSHLLGSGDLCQGSGECGTNDQLNNCGDGHNVYLVTKSWCNGKYLTPIEAADCPEAVPTQRCDSPITDVATGDLCIAHGECGTNPQLDNCGVHDIYVVSYMMGDVVNLPEPLFVVDILEQHHLPVHEQLDTQILSRVSKGGGINLVSTSVMVMCTDRQLLTSNVATTRSSQHSTCTSHSQHSTCTIHSHHNTTALSKLY